MDFADTEDIETALLSYNHFAFYVQRAVTGADGTDSFMEMARRGSVSSRPVSRKSAVSQLSRTLSLWVAMTTEQPLLLVPLRAWTVSCSRPAGSTRSIPGPHARGMDRSGRRNQRWSTLRQKVEPEMPWRPFSGRGHLGLDGKCGARAAGRQCGQITGTRQGWT